MSRAPAPAKVNLALVVGPLRDDGKHEVLTVLQRIDLVDRIELDDAPELRVEGFTEDTLVSSALGELAARAGVEPRWRVRIEKKIPVAAGLGGGSSDAATALKLANATLPEPLPNEALLEIAASVGADVPFFLVDGPQLGSGDGSALEPLDVPQDFWVLVLLPRDGEDFDRGRVRSIRCAQRSGGLGRAATAAPRRACPGRTPARSRRPPAERPRDLTFDGRDSRGGRVPCRRLRCRAGALRLVPPTP